MLNWLLLVVLWGLGASRPLYPPSHFCAVPEDERCRAFTDQERYLELMEEAAVGFADVWQCSAFNTGQNWQHSSCNWNFRGNNIGYRENLNGVADPAGGGSTVLSAFYQEGSRSGHPDDLKGGGHFYHILPGGWTTLYLEYDVYFDRADGGTFPWVLGGKLPGFYGGEGQCSGGVKEECFSMRYMWRADGDMELYAYLPAETCDWFCDRNKCPYNRCNFSSGHSLGRGVGRFQSGRWHTIQQYIRMNDIGQHNGITRYWLDGELKYEMWGLAFRDTNFKIDHFYFSTFFGGSTDEWAATADCYTYYRNFRAFTPAY